MIVEIPVTAEASTFSTILNDVTLQLTVTYNARYGYWTAEIAQDDVVLVRGLALLLGGNIIRQYNLPFAGLFMFDNDRTNVDADEDDLGDRVILLAAEEQADFAALQEVAT